MILYNIVKISKNRLIGYMLKVAFLLASSIYRLYLVLQAFGDTSNVIRRKCSQITQIKGAAM